MRLRQLGFAAKLFALACAWSAPVRAAENLLINPFAEIDQANEGAAATLTNFSSASGRSADGWVAFYKNDTAAAVTVQQVEDAPVGLKNSVKVTVGTGAKSVESGDWLMLYQAITPEDMHDLGFGTTNAAPVSASFWFKSSLPGTFAFALNNGPGTRNYTIPFTISMANTWTEIVLPGIPGDVGGNWAPGTHNQGMWFQVTVAAGSTYQTAGRQWVDGDFIMVPGPTTSLMLTTSGASFQVTGAQLVKGATVGPLEHRPFPIEMLLCGSRFQKTYSQGTSIGTPTSIGQRVMVATGQTVYFNIDFGQPIVRALRELIVYSPATGAPGMVRDVTAGVDIPLTSIDDFGDRSATLSASGATAGHLYAVQATIDARLY
ncbi:MAG: hypothetical protein JO366_19365 [Methylobacteriaceae bacterium]|nr:hypothetical protein [Methylobacteriaceae bacterium]